jgi:hypothetical protein
MVKMVSDLPICKLIQTSFIDLDCTRAKPYLYKQLWRLLYYHYTTLFMYHFYTNKLEHSTLLGKNKSYVYRQLKDFLGNKVKGD